jgi:arylsulfatase A-like enzyme
MARRPNFLFLITDQQRADHLGCYGHKVLRTPHIDSIAARGVRFDRFFVATPICMPNRATLMTGRMPSTHGVRHNGIPLSLGAMTFVEALRRAGYRTIHVGKSHLQNMTGKPPLTTYGAGRAPAHAPTSGRYDQEDLTRWREVPRHDLDYPFYGFDSADLCNDHADATEGHYTGWLRERHPHPDSLRGPKNAIPTPDYVCPQAWRTRVPEELYATSYVRERTIDRLAECARSGDQPFFLHCSFPDPHHPWTPPGKYWGMYSPADVELPASWKIDRDKAPPHVRWCLDQRDAGKAVKHTQALFAVTEREAREATALTFDMITMIDDAIGAILAQLERLGLANDTIVVFTSDHGDFMGDHQLMLKGPIHYQSVIRVPFIWSDPHGGRGSSDALSGTIDIAPTILERAGIETYHGIQGHPLGVALTGQSGKVRDALVLEEEGQRTYLGFDNRVRMRTLLTERHRISVYDGAAWGELYDFAEDPHEMRNLWADSGRAATKAELTNALLREMLSLVEVSPAPSAIA